LLQRACTSHWARANAASFASDSVGGAPTIVPELLDEPPEEDDAGSLSNLVQPRERDAATAANVSPRMVPIQ